LTKPVRKQDLLEVVEGSWIDDAINNNLSLAENCDETSGRAAAEGEAPQVVEQSKVMNAEGPVFDAAAAMERVGGDADVFKSVVEAFLEETPLLMNALHRAVANGDAPKVRLAAHTLKGSASVFGASTLRRAFQTLEDSAKQGALADQASVFAQIDAQLPLLQAALRDCVDLARV
jgi:two-component system, sensor histidine kinase and response regulator